MASVVVVVVGAVVVLVVLLVVDVVALVVVGLVVVVVLGTVVVALAAVGGAEVEVELEAATLELPSAAAVVEVERWRSASCTGGVLAPEKAPTPAAVPTPTIASAPRPPQILRTTVRRSGRRRCRAALRLSGRARLTTPNDATPGLGRRG